MHFQARDQEQIEQLKRAVLRVNRPDPGLWSVCEKLGMPHRQGLTVPKPNRKWLEWTGSVESMKCFGRHDTAIITSKSA